MPFAVNAFQIDLLIDAHTHSLLTFLCFRSSIIALLPYSHISLKLYRGLHSRSCQCMLSIIKIHMKHVRCNCSKIGNHHFMVPYEQILQSQPIYLNAFWLCVYVCVCGGVFNMCRCRAICEIASNGKISNLNGTPSQDHQLLLPHQLPRHSPRPSFLNY